MKTHIQQVHEEHLGSGQEGGGGEAAPPPHPEEIAAVTADGRKQGLANGVRNPATGIVKQLLCSLGWLYFATWCL